MTTEAAHPFVIGDEPVVTFERTERNTLSWLQGFARRHSCQCRRPRASISWRDSNAQDRLAAGSG